MGMIQSSLNQLTLSVLGAGAGLVRGLKSAVKNPNAPTGPQPNSEVTPSMGNNVKIDRVPGYRRYMAGTAALSGNDMIAQKARATFKPLAERLKTMEATSVDFSGGMK